jgi:hypothetical protein
MRRFALLAATSVGLTLILVYEGSLSAIRGLEVLVGIGTPRLVASGLIDLGLAALLLNLSWLTARGARQLITIARLMRSRERTT